MRKLILIIPLTLLFCITAQTSRATKAYVTDSFSVRLHGGPGMENSVLKFLPSGLPVEVLESRADWSLVQSLQDGDNAARGWIMTRYLMTREPWESQVGQLMKDLSLLRQKLRRVERDEPRQERS